MGHGEGSTALCLTRVFQKKKEKNESFARKEGEKKEVKRVRKLHYTMLQRKEGVSMR
jgi:hypothetical protein